ncbi:peptidylprolyl isomerase [Pontibacter sp. E15-1]|uniref:peptidylprolyl isomerase n=1 Tax=Pontibacter sp. E15-1 TaxID=2919918 RepID=UPI001F4FC60D|nr:peptidylprolyl isomerase [Pontibacter sp. E15-1]MCJ8163955.1 peptidylprolyl isomerase [Pontibacter sp. E15-1]
MKNPLYFAKVAFVAICLMVFSSALHAQAPVQRKVDGIIAKVDNYIVLRSDVEFGYLQYLQQSKQQPNEELKCDIFRSLLQDKLLLARAEIDSVVVDEPMVADQLNRRIQYLAGQVGGVERLEQYYNKSINQLKEELRRTVREQMVMEKMQQEISGKVVVTPKEIRKYFNSIPTDSLPYFSSEVELGQIVKFAAVSKTQKQAAREQLEALRARIVAGEDFQTLAKQFSQDPGSAQAGGELGFFKKKELVPEYEAAALRLEPGGMSNVIESQFGFHLIQLIERRGQEFNTRHILIKPATATVDVQEAATELDSIRTLILNDSLTFAKAAKDFSDDKTTKDNGGMMRNGSSGGTYISMDQVDPSIFFVIDTMTVGDISRPIPFTTEDGKQAMRIIYLKGKSKPHLANLKDDYQRISTAALSEKRGKAVDEWFRKNIGTVFIEIDPEYQDCGGLQQLMQ